MKYNGVFFTFIYIYIIHFIFISSRVLNISTNVFLRSVVLLQRRRKNVTGEKREGEIVTAHKPNNFSSLISLVANIWKEKKWRFSRRYKIIRYYYFFFRVYYTNLTGRRFIYSARDTRENISLAVALTFSFFFFFVFIVP